MTTRDDGLRTRLDELCRQGNTEVIREISSFQEKHFARFSREYGRFIDQYEMFYSTLVSLTYSVNYYDKSNWPQHRALQFTLAAHSQKQLYTAHLLLQKGFYEDSITVIRSAYETFLRILFISCNQKHSWSVFYKEGGSPKFIPTNFVKDELRLDWPTYGLMSAFAHSNKVDVLEDIIKLSREAQKEPIALRLKYDEKRMGIAINYLQFLMLVFLKLLNEVFVTDYGSHRLRKEIQVEFDRAKEYAELLMQVMETHTDNATWRVMAKDIKNIFELIRLMEFNGERPWKEVWAEVVAMQ